MGTTLIKQAMKQTEELAAHRCKPRSDGADVILEYNIYTKSFCRDFPVHLNGMIDPDMYRKILAEVEAALKQYSDSQSDAFHDRMVTPWQDSQWCSHANAERSLVTRSRAESWGSTLES